MTAGMSAVRFDADTVGRKLTTRAFAEIRRTRKPAALKRFESR